jgi:basic membrane protein A and related proteins
VKRTLSIVVLLLSAVALSTAAGGGAASGDRFRVGIVTDTPGVNIPIFRLMRDGLERAVRELGVEGKVLTPGAREGHLPSFLTFAQRRYDLVVGFGFYQLQAIDRTAQRFPDVRFVLVDLPHTRLAHRPRNVSAVVFAEQEIGYLAGYLAALTESRRPGKDVVSSVGAFDQYPPVEHFIAGYEAGARKANPAIRTLRNYTFDFIDRAKCRRAALSQIAKGSGVVFNVAGECGFGTLAAAKEKGVWGIGIDIDQSSLGPHILTSAVKRFDQAVFETIKDAKAGRLEGGRTRVLRLRDRALGLGRISPKVPRAVIAQVEGIRRQIVAGTIREIPTTVG